MARCNFSIKVNIECNPGCHTSRASRHRSEDLQPAEGTLWDRQSSACPLPIGLHFNGVSVIFNCLTPAHWDGKSRRQWYDLLVTLESYQNCNLELLGLGLSLEYGPGTVVGLMGSTLEHQVSHFEGERVCCAYFMRDSMHEWAKVPGSSWATTSYYQ